MPDHDADRHTAHGEDVLSALAFGDDLASIRMDALDKARALFGPDAVLQIESVSGIMTASGIRGAFMATVIVRRMDGGEEWIPPLGGSDA
jgi:hypothetical protein